MAVVSMKQLLEAGVHFGHQTRRWNPKMAQYIFTERNGIYIIDLQKTSRKGDEAYAAVKEIAAERNSSIHTITTHKKNIFRKLQINSVYEATKYALRAGLLEMVEYYI